MKKALAAFALLASITLTGCNPATPSKLIKPPQLEITQAQVQQAIEQFLPKEAKLTMPLHPTKASTFEQVDLNGDGSDEIVAYYKKGQNNFELGALVLEKTAEQWNLLENIENLGQNIDYANFLDITGDKIPEMLIGWSGDDNKVINKDLTIYTCQNKKIKQLAQTPYIDLSAEDLDGDNKTDLALIYKDNDKEIPTAVVQLYQYVHGKFQQTADPIEFEGYADKITIGNATQDRLGIFVDMVIGAHSAYTQLLILENGQLNTVFTQEDDFPITYKPYPLPTTDIDEDGIIEIGIKNAPPGTEDMAMYEMPWIESWYKWDGKDGLVPVINSYADYGEEYRFEIPQKWHDKYTIRRVAGDDELQSVVFHYIGQDKKLTKLLSIDYVNKDNWSEEENALKKEKVNYTVLGENNTNIFVGILPSERPNLSGDYLKEYQQMLLDQEQLTQAFKMLNISKITL